MDLNEAITLCVEKSKNGNNIKCRNDHAQLAQWLRELKELKEWKPFESIPRDNTPVLVKLEKPILKSKVHVAWFNNRGVDIIGSQFAFDCPKVIGWKNII